ncbi:Signal-transducing histidine kinase protein [Halorhabdus tiamatea SARL4B]|uniref:histidine kinase n=1 Tax=Halorhabdus tiamatea SARL4B TaxID=1033806 RepID=F7PG19_9EURY|nr:HAMP domain-containing sensor histidine kinase [Halorhabdus tiamatea]ERJ07259.1 Signal-transducing histidine kinase protein [Halorhabdus tiamatea SARL4B]CCQ34169.1 signal-transducing histidine kinase [Halorhabdus tiamatea SARL4B]
MAKQRADAALAGALSTVSPWGVRLVCAGVIAATGLAAGLVPFARLFAMPAGVSGPVVGVFAPVLFGGAVLAGGYWLARSDFDGSLAAAVTIWWFLGTAFGAFTALGLVAYQIGAGVSVADVAIVLSAIASIGGVGGLLVGRYDVRSQRRRRELEREHERLADERQKLVLLNRIVRHDIGNDLQIISGMSGHLETHVDEGGAEYLARVQRTTEEAIQLTEQVRAFVTSLGESEYSTKRRISLQRVLDTQVQNTREVYREASVSVDGEVPDVEIYADELLSTLFHNLLSNAVEHNDRDYPSVEVRVERDNESVTVSIADDGPGIPPAERERLRGVDTDPDPSGESGLGLYIVGMLLERYDGSVSIDDRKPRGTVVTVELPIADGE